MNIEKGRYESKITGTSLAMYDSGAVMFFAAVDSGLGQELKYSCPIVAKDGSPNANNIKKLMGIFEGWDGCDLHWIVDPANTTDVACLADIDQEPDRKDPSKMWWAAVNIYRTDYTGGATLPKSSDIDAIMKRYGSVLRAVNPPKAPTNKAPAPSKPKPATKPKADVKLAETQDDAWQLCNDLNGDKMDTQVQDYWERVLEEELPGVGQEDFGPEDWKKISRRFHSDATK